MMKGELEVELLEAKVNKKGMIESNMEEVEKQLIEMLSVYEGIVVTEDTVAASKKDVAELRKTKASIDDARKNVKKQWMQPYTEFEEKCKHLLELVDKPINEINEQVKAFEDAKKEEKRKLVTEIYEKSIGEYAEYLPLESIFDEKWLNVSTKQRDIEYDINERKTRVMSEISTIKALGSEIEQELLDTYKRNGNNLSAAVQRNTQYINDKAKIETQVREEVKAEQPKEEPKPKTELMGELNNIVNAFKLVHFVVSIQDEEEVENLLNLSGISFTKREE